MKKLFFIFIFLYFCILTGCVGKYVDLYIDPYQAYRGKTSTELFTAGERALTKKNYAEAIKNFEALDVVYPFDFYTQQAQLDIIYAYYKSRDIASANVAADRYVCLYPQGHYADYAYYMRGIINFGSELSLIQKLVGVNPASLDISILQQSYKAFATLIDMFPKSPYAPDALIRMKHIQNLMAQREIMIAQFYLKRHAYVAAANHATYVVQNFQDSPEEVTQGFMIMIQAYRALDLPKMADFSYRLFKISYPNSPNLQKLRG
ncbi:MAG: outer membrane protein assembly factor BamD [Coxiella endosymbiont of Dermacentor silvarum]